MNHDPKPNTFARAEAGYDPAHEERLVAVLTEALLAASRVSDCNAAVIRTGEAAAALTTILAGVLSMSPHVTRSPTAIRRITDDLNKRLRSKVAATTTNTDFAAFMRQVFRDDGTSGSA